MHWRFVDENLSAEVRSCGVLKLIKIRNYDTPVGLTTLESNTSGDSREEL